MKKQKLELQDQYYGQLIEFTKYNYLQHDIKWMTEMRQKLLDGEKIKSEREAKKQELIEKRRKEQEERDRLASERKEREEARKQKELEEKRELDEQTKEREIQELQALQEALDDNSIGSNPLFEHIEQCEFLRKYCQK